MIYGDTSHVLKVRELYERGTGKSASSSYTGRGAYPNEHKPTRKRA
jgi:hypothetical protein